MKKMYEHIKGNKSKEKKLSEVETSINDLKNLLQTIARDIHNKVGVEGIKPPSGLTTYAQAIELSHKSDIGTFNSAVGELRNRLWDISDVGGKVYAQLIGLSASPKSDSSKAAKVEAAQDIIFNAKAALVLLLKIENKVTPPKPSGPRI